MSFPAACVECTLPYVPHIYWRGAPGTPGDSSRACFPLKFSPNEVACSTMGILRPGTRIVRARFRARCHLTRR